MICKYCDKEVNGVEICEMCREAEDMFDYIITTPKLLNKFGACLELKMLLREAHEDMLKGPFYLVGKDWPRSCSRKK